MSKNTHIAATPISCLAILGAFSTCSLAQTTPTEFAEMSLQELFDESIDADEVSQAEQGSKWSFALQFRRAKFDGYLDGSKSLSYQDVLFNAGEETRTAKNFPVLPTVITQNVTLFSTGYQFSRNWRAHITLPYIHQSTDHISIVQNYDFFVIDSSGIGDTSISSSYRFMKDSDHDWWFSAGISIPTGSIDEIGDTPRDAGDQQLPYTMQLGSGTYDFPLELSFQSKGDYDYAFSVSANIRTGKNDRDYRLGNNLSVSGSYRYTINSSLKAFTGLEWQYADAIHGRDTSLLVPGEFEYPAGITNPDLYGGKKLNISLGLNWKINPQYRLTVEYSTPLYQHLNGPQPKELWHSAIKLTKVL